MRYLSLVVLLAFLGCAGQVTISTEISGPDDWSWTQTIEGESEAVVEAAKQMFDGKLETTDEGISVTLKSGQDAANMATQESQLLRGIVNMMLKTQEQK